LKPFLVFGLGDKARQNYAEQVALKNSYIFHALDSKEILNYSKEFLSSTLDASRIVFYIYDVNKLTFEACLQFLELIRSSPHIFILSSPTFLGVNSELRKVCQKIPLSSKLDEMTEVIRNLMINSDRDAVRVALIDVDHLYLFHKLKFGCWHSAETLGAMLEISQYIYKCKADYIKSLLAFALPAKPYALSHAKKEKNKLQESILSKLTKAYRQNSAESANLYLLIRQMHFAPEEVQLTEEERDFLGVTLEAQTPEAPFVAAANLEDFF